MGWVLLPPSGPSATSPNVPSLLGEEISRPSLPPKGGVPAKPGKGDFVPGTTEVYP